MQGEEVKVADTDAVAARRYYLLAGSAGKIRPAQISFKPVDRAVGEAILAWRRSAPSSRRQLTTRRLKHSTACSPTEGQAIGAAHLNTRLIPMLCRKAGVPETDAQGPIHEPPRPIDHHHAAL